MDKIINWLLLTIIFVFDPLAIALVVAANFAFEQLRPKTRENIYGEKVIVEEDDDGYWTEEEIADFKNQSDSENELGDSFAEEFDEFDINQDGVLDEDELKAKEDALLKRKDISGWRKNKILRKRKQNGEDDLTIRY